MAKITATQTFLDDRDRYEEGESYDVDGALAAYFIRSGWATSDDVDGSPVVQPQDVTLDIQSAKHTATATKG